ncbi:PAAR domain-containing protein [Massilia sp.]|uniref:PAAR domain-containing protein n=1 Tax=Massilia sp. TaxID=1882437 RepID=UPI00352E2A1F
MKPLIVIGDKTSHGGTVITCSSISTTNGKGWARVGDMVSCPRCKGVFPIAQGDNGLRTEGRAVAYDGCKTACGALLISSQTLSLTGPVDTATPAALGRDVPVNLKSGFGLIATRLASDYKDEPVGAGTDRFRGRFQLVDAVTGEPVSNQTVRVRSTGGQSITGRTDANGYTDWVERDAREALAFDLLQDDA